MNATDWLNICKAVEARWGSSKRWDRAGDLALDKQVVGLDFRFAETAVYDIADDHAMTNAPSPVTVLRLGHSLQATHRRLEAGLSGCRHRNWAFLDMDTNAEGRRHGTCVACGTEKWFDPGKLLTATEAGHESGQFPDLVPPEPA